MLAELDDLAFRETVFAWLRDRLLTTDVVTRDDLAQFEFQGRRHRLVGPQTGIWRVKGVSDAAISIVTSYVPDGHRRPYDDEVGDDGLLRQVPRHRPQHRRQRLAPSSDGTPCAARPVHRRRLQTRHAHSGLPARVPGLARRRGTRPAPVRGRRRLRKHGRPTRDLSPRATTPRRSPSCSDAQKATGTWAPSCDASAKPVESSSTARCAKCGQRRSPPSRRRPMATESVPHLRSGPSTD